MKFDRISKTAAFIAIKFYGLTKSGTFRSLFDQQTLLFYDRLVSSLPSPLNFYHAILDKSYVRKMLISLEELFLPGDLLHVIQRKYFIQGMVEKLKQKGSKQLIILGSGFDHLGSIFSKAGLRCFEIDVPGTIRTKQQFLKKYGYEHKNLTVCPINFSNTLLNDIIGAINGIDPAAETVVVAEGFFDYLSPSETNRILNDLSGFFDNKVTLVSTVFSLDELFWFHSLVFKTSVRLVGEQLKLYRSLHEFNEILERNHFQTEKVHSSAELKSKLTGFRYSDWSILDGFYIIEARLNKF